MPAGQRQRRPPRQDLTVRTHRPQLRLAAWCAVWAALPNDAVLAARFHHLTTREDNRLARQQARPACAAALLRWLYVVVTGAIPWNPAIAAGDRTQPRPRNHRSRPHKSGRGGPERPSRNISRMSMSSPDRLPALPPQPPG